VEGPVWRPFDSRDAMLLCSRKPCQPPCFVEALRLTGDSETWSGRVLLLKTTPAVATGQMWLQRCHHVEVKASHPGAGGCISPGAQDMESASPWNSEMP
jgi:hypothetical protein